jgi:hypothetical protein
VRIGRTDETADLGTADADLPSPDTRPTASRPAAAAHAVRSWATHGVARQLWLLLAYVLIGFVVTWPRVDYLAGRMPNTRDQGSYAWDMWWMAHQVTHFGNPFSTTMIYAPVGTPLAYHSMMPLLGLIMVPVTLIAGGAFSANLLSVLVPGLAAYAMYRAARLWLPPVGAFASGTLFGMATMLDWRAWFHLNLAAGAVFLPITLEAAVRLRRNPSISRSVVLGLVVGLCLLVDSESAILCAIVVAAVLLPLAWSQPRGRNWRLIGVAVATGLVVSAAQLVAMIQQRSVLHQSPAKLAKDYVDYGVSLTQIFAPSPRVSAFGLNGLGRTYFHGITTEGMPTFGVTLTALALVGAVVGWRSWRTRGWLLLWLAGTIVALGPVLYIGRHAYAPLPLHDHGKTLSWLMPYTWLVHLPGLSGFREANRFTVLALVPAALLAGCAVTWLREKYAAALAIVVVLAVTELGWSGALPYEPVPHLSLSTGAPVRADMATDMPAVDRAIKADHSNSLVVDVPLGFRSGTLEYGAPFPAEALVLATRDHHPRAVGYAARLPQHTVDLLREHTFYTAMLRAQRGARVSPALAMLAAADARRMDVGWVVVWERVTPRLGQFLSATGFHFLYRAAGVSVYRG